MDRVLPELFIRNFTYYHNKKSKLSVPLSESSLYDSSSWIIISLMVLDSDRVGEASDWIHTSVRGGRSVLFTGG